MKLAPVAEKITKILPRLASDQSSEVVASVLAVQRLLESVGADWHDFTAAFEQGVANGATASRPSRAADSGSDFPQWETLSLRERVAWIEALNEADWLSVWERNFVASIRPRVRRYWGLSQKQRAVVNRLLARAYARGVEPQFHKGG